MKEPAILSWSSGKDSAMALHRLLHSDTFRVVALLTTVSDEYKRISHHGVREQLLDAQAAAIGIPLTKIHLPSNNSHPCTNAMYDEIMAQALAPFHADGVRTVAFGDLFLEDLRLWREQNLAKINMRALFPLWKQNTTALAKEIISLGFQAHLSCVEGKVGPGFAGRPYDAALLRDLPPGIDPCGEYGEFHTFVHNGPIFKQPLAIEVGPTVIRDGRYYADLLPAGMQSDAESTHANIPPVGTLSTSQTCVPAAS